MENKSELLKELLKSCFVPELTRDLDSEPLKSDHFESYRSAVKLQLPILYDFLQSNKDWSFCQNEEEKLELQSLLLVLLSEFHAKEAVYSLAPDQLHINAKRLLEEYANCDRCMLPKVFTYYHDKLHKDRWKKNLGAIYGYLHFIRIFFGRKDTRKMPKAWLMFSLSIGLTVRDVHEPEFKEIGIQIFLAMMDSGQSDDIQSANVHSVIYDSAFKDVYQMNSVSATSDVWNCLLQCLDYYSNIDSLSWSQADDMMDVLLRNISLATNSIISAHQLTFVTKLCAYFSINRKEIEATLGGDMRQERSLQECRSICECNNSYTSYRWAKSILNMFTSESYRLLQSSEVCVRFLEEIHRCYLVAIYPIPLKVVQPHLVGFLKKFTATLMEVIVVHKRASLIVELIEGILQSFFTQIRQPECDELVNCRNAFKLLLEHKTFDKISIK